MTDPRHHLRLLLIAFAAISGMLSLAGDASASTSARQKTVDSCCLKRACTTCCCPSARRDATDSPAASLQTSRTGVTTPPLPACQCRTNEPSAPARRPDSDSVDPQKRTDHDRGEWIALTVGSDPSTRLARLSTHTTRRPTAHLSLLNTRLLI